MARKNSGFTQVRQVWLVVASCGQYDDHKEWNVAAYPDKRSAALHAKRADRWAAENEPPEVPVGGVMSQFGHDKALEKWARSAPYDPFLLDERAHQDWPVEYDIVSVPAHGLLRGALA